MRVKRFVGICAVVLLVVLCIGFTGCDWLRGVKKFKYKVPEERGDGWASASLTDVGMDPERVEALGQRYLDDYEGSIHSVQVVKDGYLVWDHYFDKEAEHSDLMTMERGALGVTNQLMGLAVEQGFIDGLHLPVFNYYPQYAQYAVGDKADITLRHLLEMTSGLEWDETSYPYNNSLNSLGNMVVSEDQIQYVLSRPSAYQPGDQWCFNCGGSLVLSEVLHISTGMEVDDFARQYLFQPLNIRESMWGRTGKQVIITYNHLKLRPRDMIKIMYLMINDGRWINTQVLSADWVRESIKDRHATAVSGRDYGIHWGKRKVSINGVVYDMIVTEGSVAHVMLGIKELNLAVLITGTEDAPAAMSVDAVNFIVKAAIPGLDESDETTN